MITKRLSLPGNFVEAFLYFDFLWLISPEGDTWSFDMLKFINSKFSDAGVAHQCAMAFARNDQILNPFSDFNPDFIPDAIEVTLDEVERYSRIFDTRLDFRSILDMRCYYGRVFVATDNSIRQLTALSRSDLAHVALGRRANGQLGGEVVHDARCVQFRCQYGTISAACAYDGGFYAAGASSPDPSWRPKFKQFANHSLATEFVADRLTNVPEANDVEFFKTDYHRTELIAAPVDEQAQGEDSEQYEISSVQDYDAEISDRTKKVVNDDRLLGKVSRIFLSKSALFAVDSDHVIRSIKLLDGQRFVQQLTRSRPFPAARGPILAMTSSAIGMVAELDEEVAVLAGGRWHTIFSEAVYSVRGYPSSKWYRNLTTAVGAERTDLIFLKH